MGGSTVGWLRIGRCLTLDFEHSVYGTIRRGHSSHFDLLGDTVRRMTVKEFAKRTAMISLREALGCLRKDFA